MFTEYLARYFGIDTPINSSIGIKEFKELAQSLMTKTILQLIIKLLWSLVHVNVNQKPRLYICPLNKLYGFQTSKVNSLPVKVKKTKS